jgi:uncharacterized membrane protein YhaH (DUF805 family)
MEWYLEVWRKFGDFQGRARRREYWMNYLMNAVVAVALYGLMLAGGERLARVTIVLIGAYWLAAIIPNIAVTARRLHDTGRSGWWMFISLLPLVGPFIMLYFLVQDGESGRNEYGVNPKAAGMFGGSTPAASFGQ